VTDEMMSLRTLVEKSSDAELLREMIGFAAERLMALEVETLTGAAHGERSPERITWRNGYRDRIWGRAGARSNCASPSSGRAATSRHSWEPRRLAFPVRTGSYPLECVRAAVSEIADNRIAEWAAPKAAGNRVPSITSGALLDPLPKTTPSDAYLLSQFMTSRFSSARPAPDCGVTKWSRRLHR
jgi:mutator family transposase